MWYRFPSGILTLQRLTTEQQDGECEAAQNPVVRDVQSDFSLNHDEQPNGSHHAGTLLSDDNSLKWHGLPSNKQQFAPSSAYVDYKFVPGPSRTFHQGGGNGSTQASEPDTSSPSQEHDGGSDVDMDIQTPTCPHRPLDTRGTSIPYGMLSSPLCSNPSPISIRSSFPSVSLFPPFLFFIHSSLSQPH